MCSKSTPGRSACKVGPTLERFPFESMLYSTYSVAKHAVFCLIYQCTRQMKVHDVGLIDQCRVSSSTSPLLLPERLVYLAEQ